MNKKKVLAAFIALIMVFAVLSGCEGQRTPVVYNLYYSKDDDFLIGVAAAAIESTVEIRAEVSGSNYAGSGVIVATSSSKTFIITNNHVVCGSSGTTPGTVYVYAAGAEHTVLTRQKADVLWALKDDMDKKGDLALISVSKKSSHAAATYSVEELSFGQHILAVGNALDYGTSVCDGIISNPSLKLDEKKYNYEGNVIQITAPINSGNSGGGLFDMKARLIGINTFKATAQSPDDKEQRVFAEGISFSIRMSDVKDFVDRYNAKNPSNYVTLVPPPAEE